MKTKTKTIAIIPARKGSKRIPNKNKIPFYGKPMIEWTIRSALDAKLVDTVVVSTDDEEIMAIASKFENVIAIQRPDELCTDTASINSAVQHAIDHLNIGKDDTLLLLQPPCPLRSSADVNGALQVFFDSKPASVVSITEDELPTAYSMVLPEQNSLDTFYDEITALKSVPTEHRLNGAIYVASVKTFEKSGWFAKPGMAYVMPRERSIDIDTPLDLVLGESLAKYLDI